MLVRRVSIYVTLALLTATATAGLSVASPSPASAQSPPFTCDDWRSYMTAPNLDVLFGSVDWDNVVRTGMEDFVAPTVDNRSAVEDWIAANPGEFPSWLRVDANADGDYTDSADRLASCPYVAAGYVPVGTVTTGSSALGTNPVVGVKTAGGAASFIPSSSAVAAGLIATGFAAFNWLTQDDAETEEPPPGSLGTIVGATTALSQEDASFTLSWSSVAGWTSASHQVLLDVVGSDYESTSHGYQTNTGRCYAASCPLYVQTIPLTPSINATTTPGILSLQFRSTDSSGPCPAGSAPDNSGDVTTDYGYPPFPWSCGIRPNMRARLFQVSTNSLAVGPYLSDLVRDSGSAVQYEVSKQCVLPGGAPASPAAIADRSLWGTTTDEPFAVAPQCPAGSITSMVSLRRQWFGIPSSLVFRWQADPASITDPDKRVCYTAGASECPPPKVELSPDGTSLASIDPSGELVTLPELLEQASPAPAAGSGTDPNPTTTSVTTVPDGEVPALSPPGRPDLDLDDADGCVSDLLPDDYGVTINPVTWVRAVLTFVWAPIVCALLWLVVPEDGWPALLDRFKLLFTGHPAIEPFVGFWSGVTADGSCPTFDVGPYSVGPATFGPYALDISLCGNPILQGIWGVMFLLATLGLGSSLRTGIARFGSWRSQGPDTSAAAS